MTSESLGSTFQFVDFPLDGMTFNREYVVSGGKFPGFCLFQGGNCPNAWMLYTHVCRGVCVRELSVHRHDTDRISTWSDFCVNFFFTHSSTDCGHGHMEILLLKWPGGNFCTLMHNLRIVDAWKSKNTDTWRRSSVSPWKRNGPQQIEVFEPDMIVYTVA